MAESRLGETKGGVATSLRTRRYCQVVVQVLEQGEIGVPRDVALTRWTIMPTVLSDLHELSSKVEPKWTKVQV